MLLIFEVFAIGVVYGTILQTYLSLVSVMQRNRITYFPSLSGK